MPPLNTRGYDPLDNDSDTGYRRPPRDPACVCDYFECLMGIEDDGEFMHAEMGVLLNNPDEFFTLDNTQTALLE